MRVRFWFPINILFAMSCLLYGCFEETETLTLNKDGSGNYESTVRLNPQMSIFMEMAEKYAAARGLPSTETSPFGPMSGKLESSIRSRMEQMEGIHLRKLEITHFGEGDERKQIALDMDFDDINTFLASPFGLGTLGLRLSKDDEGNVCLKGTPGELANVPTAGVGTPGLAVLISQMKATFGVTGDPELDALFRRLIDSPRTSLTFVAPTPVKQTNGTLVADNKVEWNLDIADAASTLAANFYEIVLEGEGLEFEVNEMPETRAMRPPEGAPSSLSGQPAPDFTLTDLEGKSVSLSDFKGKVVILDFWATWCRPCVVEIPYFIKMQEELGQKGFTMLGVSMDRGTDVVRKFVDEHGVNYPVLMADANVRTLYGGIRGIPTTFVLDKDGVIRRHYVGTKPESVFRQDVTTLLAGEELSAQTAIAIPSSGLPQQPVSRAISPPASPQPVIATEPSDGEVYIQGSGSTSEAPRIEITRRVPPPMSREPHVLNSRAWYYVQQKTNIEEAVKLAEQAVELAPEGPSFRDTLAWAYLRAERYTEALDLFGKILEISPDLESSWEGLFEFGKSEVPERDFLEFSEHLSEILPDVPRVRFRRDMIVSNWYRNRGDLKTAEEIFTRCGLADETIWKVAGPFPQQHAQGLSEIYDAETEILSFGLDDINPEKADWHSINDGRQDGFLDFQKTLSPYENVVAYALIDLVSETERDANLRLGSDDGVKVWLNGELVWQDNIPRIVVADQDILSVHLQKGKNRFLVKVSQNGGGWGFYFRVTDIYANPVPGIKFAAVPAIDQDDR